MKFRSRECAGHTFGVEPFPSFQTAMTRCSVLYRVPADQQKLLCKREKILFQGQVVLEFISPVFDHRNSTLFILCRPSPDHDSSPTRMSFFKTIEILIVSHAI